MVASRTCSNIGVKVKGGGHNESTIVVSVLANEIHPARSTKYSTRIVKPLLKLLYDELDGWPDVIKGLGLFHDFVTGTFSAE